MAHYLGLRYKYFYVRCMRSTVSGKNVNHLSKSFEFVVQPSENSGTQAAEELTKWLQKLWYQRILSAGITDLWLEVTEKRMTTPTEGTQFLALSMLSLGAFTSAGRYVCHWKSERTRGCRSHNLTDTIDVGYLDNEDYDGIGDERNVIQSPLVAGFEYDNNIITVSWRESAAIQWRMEVSFDSLAERVVLMKPDPSGNHLYFFLINQPKIYRAAPQARHLGLLPDFNDEETVWERDVCFGSCSRSVIGASNAVHLEIDSLECDNIDRLLQRLDKYRFRIYVGNPQTVEANWNAPFLSPRFKTFEATYAWYCLITRGFKVTDQISGEVLDFLQEQEDELLVSRLLYRIGDQFDNNCVVSLSSESLQHEWETVL